MANSDTLQKQDGFKSQFGFIMAAVGSCVGMANVWRFPMLVSRYGGLTFLIPYAIFAFIICQSGMMEEFSLGRWARSGPSGAFGKAMENGGHPKKIGEWLGGIPVIGSLCLAIGYSVVMGWVFAYTKMAITGELTAMGTDMNVIGGAFSAMAPEANSLPEAIQMTFATGGANNLWIIIGIVVSFVIMLAGISNGIEASCKIMLPILYVLFVVLAIVMIFIPGTAEGYKYIFTLDPKSLLNPEVWVYAFGQCFFSLSVAGSGSVVYGSYLGKDVKIRQSAVICAILDTSCALLAMFVIIPAMATTGADLGNGGPGLMFVSVLPVFNGIGGISRLIVIFFYVAILFAGISCQLPAAAAPPEALDGRGPHPRRGPDRGPADPALDLPVDGHCLHLHPAAGCCGRRHHVLLGHEEEGCPGCRSAGLRQAHYEVVHALRQVCLCPPVHRLLRTGHLVGRHRLIQPAHSASMQSTKAKEKKSAVPRCSAPKGL